MTKIDAINALIMCQELMLFDPMTGETHELWQENRDNQDLYNACGVAIAALREQDERAKGCEYCNSRFGIATHHVNGALLQAGTKRIANYCPMCGKRLEVEP